MRFADDFIVTGISKELLSIHQELREQNSRGKSEPEHSSESKTVNTSGLRWLAPQMHPSGVKTVVSPSQEASKRHIAAIEQRLQQLQAAPQAQVIAELNALIVGWAAYYNGVIPAATMSQYDDLMEQRLINWAGKCHPGKARDWLLTRYWHRVGGEQRRVFATSDGVQLRTYQQTSILRG